VTGDLRLGTREAKVEGRSGEELRQKRNTDVAFV
jgi:hypothetical protein